MSFPRLSSLPRLSSRPPSPRPRVPASVFLLFIISLGALAQGGPACGPAASSSAAAVKPNIILVLTDDLDLELGSVDSMAYLKSLVAEKGMTFSSFLVPLSLCCPSRTMILRGQFAHNTQVLTNSPPLGGFEKVYGLGLESATVATALQSAGYRTALLGKYLNGYPEKDHEAYIPAGWTEWYSPATGRAYGAYDYTMNENGTMVEYGSDPEDYITDVIAAKGVSFILRSAQAGSPFFVYAASYAPHSPYTPAPRHADLFPGAKAPRPPSFNEADVSDKPAYISQKELLTDKEIKNIDEAHRKRLQALQAVDEMIQAFVSAADSVGQLDNTYIFFTSDNGYHLGEHRLPQGKYTPYLTDIRVPMVARGPGIPAGAVTSEIAGNLDIAATFAEIAGVQLPVATDGRSLLSLLKGQPVTGWRKSLLLEEFKGDTAMLAEAAYSALGKGDHVGVLEPADAQDLAPVPAPGYFGYKTASYKYVEYDGGEKEIYLTERDPYELENKAYLANPEVVGRLSAFLDTMSPCVGAGCASADAAAPPPLLTAEFSSAPGDPTDLTPVTLTATAAGTAPYTYTWDLGGATASGQSVTQQFQAGTHTIKLTVQDAIGAEAEVVQSLAVAPSLMVSKVSSLSSPFRLQVKGVNFQAGCVVRINGSTVPETAFQNSALVVAKKGDALKAMLPKGVPVQVTVTNPNGGESLPFTYTR